MMTFSDSYRVIIWFSLCVFMALGMIAFAIVYGGLSFVFRKLAWKEFNFNPATFKLPKLRTAIN